MRLEKRTVGWLWCAGQLVLVVWVLAYMPQLWSDLHSHAHAQSMSIGHRIWAVTAVWTFWSLGGLIWLQKYNRERMTKH